MAHIGIEKAIKRRHFLQLCALGTVPTLLAACGGGAVNPDPGGTTTQIPPTKTPTPAPTPTTQPRAGDADWAELAKKLRGTLVRPGNPQYATARQLFSERFDTVQPAAIIYCADVDDVQNGLAFVRKFALPVTARSGGHSYAGYSTTTGVILDVTRMNQIRFDENTGNATIGAGAHLIDVYAALAQQGRAIPAGSCPTVGIAGLTLGGGVGVLGRKFGLTCDSLLAAQVVLADGRSVLCDASHESELFWALRGGGGGNFGIVTSFTFRTYAVPNLAVFTIRWPWSSAVDMVDAWQRWAPSAPDELWSNCLLLTTKNQTTGPLAQINGVYVGTAAALEPLLQQITSKINATPLSRYVSDAGLLDTMQSEGGCYGMTIAQCHLPSQNPQGQLKRDTSAAKSDYYTSVIPRAGITKLVNAIAQRNTNATTGGGGIGLDAYGGAINRVAADATAFVHRNTLFSAQYTASWDAHDPATVANTSHSWLNDTWQAMRPAASGTAYQNYIDPDLKDWQQAYYRDNLPRLQRVKGSYDPHNLFHFAQSIPPA